MSFDDSEFESGEGVDDGGDSGGFDEFESVRGDEKARAILAVLDEAGGSASTSVIRDETGLDSSGVHYRYDKLESAGLVSLEYDSSATPEGVSPMKVASLTGEGERAVARGLGGDVDDVGEEDVWDVLDRLEEEVEGNEEELLLMREWANSVEERLAELEGLVDGAVRSDSDGDGFAGE